MTSESMIALIFRWLDVVVIAAIAIYGVKRWVIPFLKEEKGREHARWIDLEQKVATQAREVHRLDKQIDHDKDRVLRLQQQVILWQAVCDQDRLSKKQEQASLIKQLQELQNKKNRYLEALSGDTRIMHEALEQAEVVLRDRAKDHQVAKQELCRAITHLKESAT